MEELSCNFCNKLFVSKQYLNKHQKTAKYCLEKQGIKNEEYKCEYCFKILSTHRRLNTHINVCKLNKNEQDHKKEEELQKYKCLSEEIEEELKKYKSLLKQKEEDFKKYKFLSEKKEKEELNNYKILLSETKMESLMKDKIIEELKTNLEKSNNTISEIAKQPKTFSQVSNNDNRIRTQNNIQQTFDINDVKRISNILEHHLTVDVLSNGQKGLADMLKKHLLQNENGEPIYECTDVSRQKFEFVNKHGFVESDPKAAKLITSLNNANIFDLAHSTGKKLWEREDGVNHDAQHVHMPRVTEVLDIKDDSSKFRSHLASITSR
jgi:hypothetical protein